MPDPSRPLATDRLASSSTVPASRSITSTSMASSDDSAMAADGMTSAATERTGAAPHAGTCQVCGNHYDKAFTVVHGGRSFVFDCFECAIHALAPSCAHCGCRIVGHGMESAGEMYCCSHCAEARGVVGMKDRT
jgi:hypothetical protein